MKKSYTNKKRTSVALDPELTKRIEKVLKNSGMKLSQYTKTVLNKELQLDEMKQTVEFYKKLQDSNQYQKIKRLEDEIEKLKKVHVTEKEFDILEMRIDKFERDEEQKNREFQSIMDSRNQTFKEAVELLNAAKKNPIIKKELDKIEKNSSKR